MRQIHRERKWNRGYQEPGELGEWGVIDQGIEFGMVSKFWKKTVVMVAQQCEYT